MRRSSINIAHIKCVSSERRLVPVLRTCSLNIVRLQSVSFKFYWSGWLDLRMRQLIGGIKWVGTFACSQKLDHPWRAASYVWYVQAVVWLVNFHHVGARWRPLNVEVRIINARLVVISRAKHLWSCPYTISSYGYLPSMSLTYKLFDVRL